MQTVTLQIKEDRLEQFLKIVDGLKKDMVEHCMVSIDEDAEYLNSAQFKKDKEMLNSRLEDIHNGKATLLTEEQYKDKMDKFTANLEQKYADC